MALSSLESVDWRSIFRATPFFGMICRLIASVDLYVSLAFDRFEEIYAVRRVLIESSRMSTFRDEIIRFGTLGRMS